MSNDSLEITNKITGEQVEILLSSDQDLVNAYLIAKEYESIAKKIKDKTKEKVESIIDDTGKSKEIDGYIFRHSVVQRTNYDKSALRKYLDEDVVDLFLEPKKTAVDKYIKDNLESLGDISTKLRSSLLPEGKPYSVTRLERIEDEPA